MIFQSLKEEEKKIGQETVNLETEMWRMYIVDLYTILEPTLGFCYPLRQRIICIMAASGN